MRAVLVSVNAELFQMKHLLMILGYIYSGETMVKTITV